MNWRKIPLHFSVIETRKNQAGSSRDRNTKGKEDESPRSHIGAIIIMVVAVEQPQQQAVPEHQQRHLKVEPQEQVVPEHQQRHLKVQPQQQVVPEHQERHLKVAAADRRSWIQMIRVMFRTQNGTGLVWNRHVCRKSSLLSANISLVSSPKDLIFLLCLM